MDSLTWPGLSWDHLLLHHFLVIYSLLTYSQNCRQRSSKGCREVMSCCLILGRTVALPISFQVKEWSHPLTPPLSQLRELQENYKKIVRVPRIRGNWHFYPQLETCWSTDVLMPFLGLSKEYRMLRKVLGGYKICTWIWRVGLASPLGDSESRKAAGAAIMTE